MTRTSPIQVAFSSGELTPLLARRFDYQRFQTGLAKCQGFLPLAQGGFTRAPGTFYKGTTRGNAQAVLVPFQFAEDDALTLEFTPGFMRVWRYGQLVMAGAAPYELATPYDAAALANLRWLQSADVIYLCDGLRPIYRLARYALNNWTLTPWVLEDGPFRTQNLDVNVTLRSGSFYNGSIFNISSTLTANTPFFAANHVGSLIKLEPTNFTTVPLFTTNETVAVGQRRRYGPNVYQLVVQTAAHVGQNPPVHTEGDALTQNGTTWRFVSDGVGIVRITAITTPLVAQVTVIKTVPQACIDDDTYRWSEGAWSARYGYPSALELYDQRMVAAASPSEPRTVWFSAIGDFADWGDNGAADGPFSYIIAGNGSINRVINLQWGGTGLHIFALGEEYSTRSESRAQAIGPTTAVFGRDGSVGSSPARPIAPSGNPIFISGDKRRVLEINYSLQADANQVRPLSRTADHMGAEKFEQIGWQGSPEPMAWLRMGSGKLAAMIYDQSEEILGWAGVSVAGGFVESMAITPDPIGAVDTLTMVVRRQINGQTVRMVEEQAAIYGILTGEDPIQDACHFFASVKIIAGSPTASFSVPHLIGQQVHAWTDLGDFGPLTVPPGGIITLPGAVNHAIIGLFDATHFAETLDIQAAAPDGNSLGRKKRIYNGVGVALHRTAQALVATVERATGRAEVVNNFARALPLSVGAPLTTAFSGTVMVDVKSGQTEEVALRFAPYGGAPMTITAIAPTIQEGGR